MDRRSKAFAWIAAVALFSSLSFGGPPSFVSQPRRVGYGVLGFFARDPGNIGTRSTTPIPTFWIDYRAACAPTHRAFEWWCKVAASPAAINTVKLCDVVGANCVELEEVRAGCFKTCGTGDCPAGIFLASKLFSPDPPVTPPRTPSDLTMSGGENSLTYRWHDNSCDADYFQVELQRLVQTGTWLVVARVAAPSAGGRWCDQAGWCEFVVNSERPWDYSGPRGGRVPPDGLLPGTLYFGRVAAVNSAGMSGSAPLSIQPAEFQFSKAMP